MRRNFTFTCLRMLICALLINSSITIHAQSNTNPTLQGSGNCGGVDETFNGDNGGFSSSTFTYNNNRFEAPVSPNSTLRIVSGLYTAPATGVANIGFNLGGTGDDDIASYTINMLSALDQTILASVSGNVTGNAPICVSLSDVDIQNKIVRVEIVFLTKNNASGLLQFDNFATNLSLLPPCGYSAASCSEGIAANFNIDEEGFTGSNGVVYNSNGYFSIADVQDNRNNYTITSGAYLANNLTLKAGFSYSGAGAKDIKSYTINVLDAATNTKLTSCTVNVNQDFNAGNGSICQTINNANVIGKNVRFQIIFASDNNASGAFILDNFRTNLPLATSTLPVEITSFDANRGNNGARLTWTVATEINVKRYDVEKSTDGRTYNKIGQVTATNSETYTYTDVQASNGTVYYRIKNVDNDGKFKYSTVISYDNGKTQLQFKAFPTATKGPVTFQHPAVNGPAAITISTLDGRILRSLKPGRGTIQTPVDLSTYPSGTYLLQFKGAAQQSETFRIFKQ